MDDDLRPAWNDIAYHWDKWGPPLRPCPEDLQIIGHALAQAWPGAHDGTKRVFLCGVTPEIATMAWPFPIDLTAMDHSESMVRVVWPGDVPGVRRAAVGSWLTPCVEGGSQDVVIGDGGFGFFDFPAGQRGLLAVLRRLIKPGGLFLYRLYAQAPRRESVSEVLAAARANTIGNFHAFKWRVAMALQANGTAGVRVHDVWKTWTEAGIDPASLAQPGWSDDAVETIRFYRDQPGRLYFPTLAEFRQLLGEFFQDTDIDVRVPQYELGDRCPWVVARVPKG